MKSTSISLLFMVVIFGVSISCFAIYDCVDNQNSLPYYGSRTIVSGLPEAQKQNIAPVSDFSFTNQDSNIVNQDFVKNKVWVANYFFTSCGTICPAMSSNIKAVQDAFKRNNNVRMISFTCDPERDYPQQLAAYAKLYKVNASQWQLATGDKRMLYRFARNNLRIIATEGDGGPDDFIHSQNLVLIDRKGYVRGYYDGTDKHSVEQLIKDIKKIL